MARRSLKPQLNQIRTWVRQGRTDAWIAHQLEVTVQQIEAFKRENGLAPGGNGDGADFDDEIDLRAEDDALIAAELEAEAERAAAEGERAAAEESEQLVAAEARTGAGADASDDEDGDRAGRRRRGRRGGRGRARRPGGGRSTLEGTFDHGDEGYGLWLDPAVTEDPVYAEHWAGHRPVEVTILEDEIVIRRAGGDDDDE